MFMYYQVPVLNDIISDRTEVLKTYMRMDHSQSQ